MITNTLYGIAYLVLLVGALLAIYGFNQEHKVLMKYLKRGIMQTVHKEFHRISEPVFLWNIKTLGNSLDIKDTNLLKKAVKELVAERRLQFLYNTTEIFELVL